MRSGFVLSVVNNSAFLCLISSVSMLAISPRIVLIGHREALAESEKLRNAFVALVMGALFLGHFVSGIPQPDFVSWLLAVYVCSKILCGSIRWLGFYSCQTSRAAFKKLEEPTNCNISSVRRRSAFEGQSCESK
jgi:hypothetical protein